MMEDVMEPTLKEAKIRDNHLSLPDNADDLPAIMIRDGLRWFTEIYENQYEAVKTVKRLLPQEIWDRYNTWSGFEDHQEVILLKKVMIPFRTILVGRNRPTLFKKGIVNEQLSDTHTKKGTKSRTPKKKTSTERTDA